MNEPSDRRELSVAELWFFLLTITVAGLGGLALLLANL